jgi:hypothetical protein
MKCASRFGVMAPVIALLAVCRPASATDLMFSFTAADLENIFMQDAGFGAGDCGFGVQISTMCGAYHITATPNLPDATFSEIDSPIPSGVGAWAVATPDGSVSWYADFAPPTDPNVTFLTGNTAVAGHLFDLYEGPPTFDRVSGIVATAPMPASAVFSFLLTTSVAGVTVDNVSWNLGLVLVSLKDDGTQGEKDVLYEETGVYLVPEPSGAWLCLTGIAALGLRKKWRRIVAR